MYIVYTLYLYIETQGFCLVWGCSFECCLNVSCCFSESVAL